MCKKLKSFFVSKYLAFSIKSTLYSTNMYATAKNNSRRHTGHKGAAKTPFCKICYDAGRPKEEYQSHYVKDRPGPHGKVVCQLLLNQQCSYCHKKGHTPKHCPEIAAKNARIAESKRQLEMQARASDMNGFSCVKVRSGRCACNKSSFKPQNDIFTPSKKQGAFDALTTDSDSEVEVEVEMEVEEDFPAIGNAPTKVAPVISGWAAVAATAPKPAPLIKAKIPEPKPKPEPKPEPELVATEKDSDTPVVWWSQNWTDDEETSEDEDFWTQQQAKTAKYAGKSWADSDWEDSSDDECDY